MTTSWPLKTSVSTPTTVPGIMFTVKHHGLPASLYLPLGLNLWWPRIMDGPSRLSLLSRKYIS